GDLRELHLEDWLAEREHRDLRDGEREEGQHREEPKAGAFRQRPAHGEPDEERLEHRQKKADPELDAEVPREVARFGPVEGHARDVVVREVVLSIREDDPGHSRGCEQRERDREGLRASGNGPLVRAHSPSANASVASFTLRRESVRLAARARAPDAASRRSAAGAVPRRTRSAKRSRKRMWRPAGSTGAAAASRRSCARSWRRRTASGPSSAPRSVPKASDQDKERVRKTPETASRSASRVARAPATSSSAASSASCGAKAARASASSSPM